MFHCVVNQSRALILAPALKCSVQLLCDWSLGSARSASFPSGQDWTHATRNIFARMRGMMLLGNSDAARSYTVKRRMHHRKKARRNSENRLGVKLLRWTKFVYVRFKPKNFNVYAFAKSR